MTTSFRDTCHASARCIASVRHTLQHSLVDTRAVSYFVLAGGLAGVGYAQAVERVSVDSVGSQSNNLSGPAAISADGRCVAFASRADNLVPSDVNGLDDIFVHDRQTGQLSCVSNDPLGMPANGLSYEVAISADGRFVAFESWATNLVPVDTNSAGDIFLYDQQTGQTSLVSVDSTGTQGNAGSYYPSISGDGRYVAFASYATNLVAADTNSIADLFVHDRTTGQTTRVNVSSSGEEANGPPDNGSPTRGAISADGRFVVFESWTSNFVPNDEMDAKHVYVRDLQLAQTTRVSVDPSGIEGGESSYQASISSDGRYVAFQSFARNLVPNDTNGSLDIFVRDRLTNHTVRVSVSSSGVQSNGGSESASISADGRYVVFQNDSPDLVPGDINGYTDVFLHDRQTSQTMRVSVNSAGAEANGNSGGAAVSGDGRYVVFASDASGLVASDTNSRTDIFVHDRQGSSPFTGFCYGDGTLATACPCAPPHTVPNPGAALGHGCANSFALSGALLSASGVPSPDTITFSAIVADGHSGFGFLVKGSAQSASGIAQGDGVRCVDGVLVRFGSHNSGSNGAPSGHWIYPNTVQTTPVSIATGQMGGEDAWYQLIYRNAAAGFCSPGTTNWTNGVRFSWPP